MSFQEIRYEVADHVLTITLNRPDRLNAFTPTMGRELIEAFDRADADDDVRAIIVTGEGRGFCAGADLGGGGEHVRLARPAGRRTRSRATAAARSRCASSSSTKPVIAAINGPAVGVGITMTLPMDIRLAAEGAKIGFVFTRRGIVPEACSSWFLPRIVGISQAMEWVATGRVFSAEEALAGGLVRSVHPQGELLGAAHALAARDRRATPRRCRSRWRAGCCGRCWAPSHPMEAHRADSRAMFARGQSDDAREGVTSFLEKREPSSRDRVSDGLPEMLPERDEPDGSRSSGSQLPRPHAVGVVAAVRLPFTLRVTIALARTSDARLRSLMRQVKRRPARTRLRHEPRRRLPFLTWIRSTPDPVARARTRRNRPWRRKRSPVSNLVSPAARNARHRHGHDTGAGMQSETRSTSRVPST